MQFRIATKPTFKHPVEIVHAAGDKGEIEFEFRYIKPKDIPAFIEQSKHTASMADVLYSIIVCWSGVKDEYGNDLAYSREALELLLDEIYCADTIFSGFMTGLRGAREKN